MGIGIVLLPRAFLAWQSRGALGRFPSLGSSVAGSDPHFAFAREAKPPLRLISPVPTMSGSGRGRGERSMRSWDGFRYCCEISASELLLKQPGALLHGIDWTADHGTTKCSSPQSLARSPHPTSPSLRRNEDARPAKFNGHMQVPRLSRWVTQ
jgi:hypothetical protein